MDLTSYMLGKKAGGGGTPATLIDKNISANGTYNASSDEADGYKKVVVDVEPNLQNKSITISTNTTTTIEKDNGYDGLGTVSVTTNVPVPVQRDWTQIGYTEEPEYVQEQFNYAKSIYDNWDNTLTDLTQKFAWSKRPGPVYFPKLDFSNATDFTECFRQNPSIQYFNNDTFGDNIKFWATFHQCYGIKEIHIKNATNINSLYYFCQEAYNLTKISFENCSLKNNIERTDGMFAYCKWLAVIDLSGLDFSVSTSYVLSNSFDNCGINCKQSDGAYADGKPYVYVKDAANQTLVLNSRGVPSNWSTANVVIKQS